MAVTTLEILFRGIAIGALAAMGFSFWRDGASKSIRVAGVLFCIGTAAYALNSSAPIISAFGLYIWPVHILAIGGGALFWLFVITLFEDRSLTPLLFAPWAVMTAIGLIAIFSGDTPLRGAMWILHNALQALLALHALYNIGRSWRDDLVEARRRIRGPLLAAVCIFAFAISAAQIGQRFGINPWWFDLASGGLLALYAVMGAALFLRSNAALFGAATPAPAEEPIAPADRAALAKLETAMGAGEAWRREGLTIGALAEEVGVPEHRLRRLINDQLGHRNFAAYVNARRIDAAKERLREPAHAQASVSAIAFDLGFGSLGPFNRAFKDATGVTPSEWRRNGSPNPENPS